MNHRMSRVAAGLAAVATLAGCSSMSSTFTKNPRDGGTYDGFPIVVNRPRFMRVTVREITSKLVENSGQAAAPAGPAKPAEGMGDLAGGGGAGGGGAAAKPSAASTGRLLEGTFTSIKVDYEVLSVGEVYTVDFRRPAAGTAEFGMDFKDGAQYPSKITYKADDKTIKELSDAVGNLAEKVMKGLSPTSGSTTINFPDGVTSVEIASTVLSVEMYDLDQLGTPNYRPAVIFANAAGARAK